MNLPVYDIWGHNWTFWLGWLWTLSSIALMGWIVAQRKSPVSTLAWIIAINLMPVIGVVVYAYFGPQRIRRKRLRRWHQRAALMSRADLEALPQRAADVPAWADQHSKLIEATCGMPLSSARDLQLLNGGGAMLPALLAAVQGARRHIHMEYYIFEPDHTGTELLEALMAQARRGVRVRLLVDALGSGRLLGWRSRALRRRFVAAGCELAVFNPARLDRLRPLVNLRTHRKIAVIDGQVGFVGGINITDDENDHYNPRHAYRDTHLRIEGGAVRWLQYVFLTDWQYAQGKPAAETQDLLPDDVPGELPVQIVVSGPDSDTEAIHRTMIDALNLARQRVWLSTPYFVPTEAALLALTSAAQRGVEVKLIVPQRSDSRLVSAAARSYYKELHVAGVKVYEYHSRMFHTKTLLVDGHYGTVGSANFDNRSFRLNFEVMAVVFDPDFNQQLAQMFEHDLACSTLVPRNRTVRRRQSFVESLARLASPLL